MTQSRGFSLIEFMVAITLALIVTAAVISVFVGSRSASQATSGLAALSDSGRFALNYIENSVRDSGYMACSAADHTISNLNPEASDLYYAPGPLGLFQPLGGYEAAGTSPGNSYTLSTTAGVLGNWNPSLDAAFSTLPSAGMGAPIVNNDVLVTRSSATTNQAVYVTAVGTDNFTTTGTGGLVSGQVAIISDCAKAVIFQVSNVSGSSPGAIIEHDIGGSPGNKTAAFPSWITFSAGAQVTPLQTTVYYIGVGADLDGALFAATVAPNNSLSASTAPTSPIELAPDIEAMQVLYGVSTTPYAQTASEYVTADQVPDFTQVMSVQVALLAAGPAGSAALPTSATTYNLFGTLVTPPIDTRLRQVFEVTIAARNALP